MTPDAALEAQAIKRLLVLQLVSSGTRVADIAATLQLPERTVRSWIPKEWHSQ